MIMSPRVVFYTGAGVSVDSGLPTFNRVGTSTGKRNMKRKVTPLWGTHRVDEVCSYGVWKRSVKAKDKKAFDKITNFYDKLQHQVRLCQPNTFHHYVASLKKSHDVHVLTTNVDDLFEKAGIPQDSITHLHGEINKYRCIECQHQFVHKVSGRPQRTVNIRKRVCPKCLSAQVKTDVIFYGENCPLYSHAKAKIDQLSNGDILIMSGSSGVTFGEMEEVWKAARSRGVKTIQVNPDPPSQYDCDFLFSTTSSKGVRYLQRIICN